MHYLMCQLMLHIYLILCRTESPFISRVHQRTSHHRAVDLQEELLRHLSITLLLQECHRAVVIEDHPLRAVARCDVLS